MFKITEGLGLGMGCMEGTGIELRSCQECIKDAAKLAEQIVFA